MCNVIWNNISGSIVLHLKGEKEFRLANSSYSNFCPLFLLASKELHYAQQLLHYIRKNFKIFKYIKLLNEVHQYEIL